ncbi:hypothetical protein HNP84_005896 [Thermocatellispora tengchongensis]|uniref:SnoaL-like domain-containing protein n=1 Tax=Thermocatellispora tengchongensis TaxID=1073253 RepID=A0A840PA55_9ACTN|nr:nuclear transport factor 2 family protein [Thermocatellispora tengchongensis]MBB5136152.1 hypothetical protein [Thermocatellispora tengchongensis]
MTDRATIEATDADRIRARAQQVFRDHLDLLSSGRTDEWAELFTEDGVLEHPYAPDAEGYEKKIVGRANLAEYIKVFPATFDVEFVNLRFHETIDPSLVIAEFNSVGRLVQTGRPIEQTYISVVETRDGKISRYVDYWNPLLTPETVSK